jgi:alanyl-tRNA synthetase
MSLHLGQIPGRRALVVAGVSTERLWITQPRRVTTLAKVVAVRRGWFALDKSLYAPTSHRRRHPQPHDQGVVWISGSKRNLVKAREEDGVLWHRLDGFVPAVGDQLNCHLDADRRSAASRAHTAMHLLLHELWSRRAPAVLEDPEVKGGSSFRLRFEASIAPKILAEALLAANSIVARNVAVERVFGVPIEVEATPQRFEPVDAFPGGEPYEAVRIPGSACYLCDGTHVERTGLVGRIVIKNAHMGRGGFVVVGAAVRA